MPDKGGGADPLNPFQKVDKEHMLKLLGIDKESSNGDDLFQKSSAP